MTVKKDDCNDGTIHNPGDEGWHQKIASSCLLAMTVKKDDCNEGTIHNPGGEGATLMNGLIDEIAASCLLAMTVKKDDCNDGSIHNPRNDGYGVNSSMTCGYRSCQFGFRVLMSVSLSALLPPFICFSRPMA